ncbi:MAG: RNA 2',3'-cyclic phosphodiesterase [Bacteroidota bacterium]
MKRIFAAVKIEPQQALHSLTGHLQQALAADHIKWVPLENMHITLKFFGETPIDKVHQIADVLNETTNTTSFDIEFTRLGIFGSSYKPRVIWLGVNDAGYLSGLAKNIQNAIVPLGYEIDRQNFVPHLTLGRINAIADKTYFQKIIDSLSEQKFEKQTISTLYLYESILSPSGPKYHILEAYKLLFERKNQ